MLCVQHEFGLFGGPGGRNLLALLKEVQAPIVTTLHTVLRNPDKQQELVMRELVRLSSRLVVIADSARPSNIWHWWAITALRVQGSCPVGRI